MFDFFKNKTQKIFAPLNGSIIPITEVPDPVFADKILGDGVAIIPSIDNNIVFSPVVGKIINTVNTLHAFGIETEDGIELLVHIGIGTVELKGEGFENLVHLGDSVKVGTPLCKVDLALLKEKGYPLYTPIVITNIDVVRKFSIHAGKASAKETCIIEYNKK